ncbi:MAG: hypothetical protein RBR75_04555, partial [Acholeplasmataceae bacterium]|nr:hypothetical protein [Acholeplasmataceae bacterium]
TLEWKTVLTTEDIYDYVEAAYPTGFQFEHVTTPDGFTFYDMSGGSVDGGWLQLPLHFRSDNEQQIMWNQVRLESTASSFRTPVTFVDSSGATRLANSQFNTNLQDAMKISVRGIIDRTEPMTYGVTAYENITTGTYSGGWNDQDLRGTTEPFETVDEFGDPVIIDRYIGVNGAQNFYFRSTSTLPGEEVEPNGASAAVDTVATVTAITEHLVLQMASGQTAIADAEYYGTVMVYIWFEGWDAEAYNGLLGRIITIGLRFGV